MSDEGARTVQTRRQRSDGIRSREAILQQAAKLATVEGIEGLSIGRLADSVGISKSGLFAHFKSKEELQLATIETADAIFRVEVVEPALEAPPGIARVRALCEAFRIGYGNAVEGVQDWVACLDVAALMARDDLRLTDKAVLRTARDTADGRYTPASLARAVSSILLQRGVEHWQDGTAGQYAMLLRECRTRIEDSALAVEIPSPRLAPVIRKRIAGLEEMLTRIEGNGEARRAAVAGGKQ